MAKVVYKICLWILFLLKLVALLIHIWSIVIAYNWFGLLGAVATGFLPLLSQILLATYLGFKAGTIFNPYTLVIIMFAGFFVATSFLKTAMMNRLIEEDPLARLRQLRF